MTGDTWVVTVLDSSDYLMFNNIFAFSEERFGCVSSRSNSKKNAFLPLVVCRLLLCRGRWRYG